MDAQKYPKSRTLQRKNRKWPSQVIQTPPIWCSVDLRDGNQSLETPMTLEQKLAFFDMLVKIGFREIEVSFPAASDTEFNFTRTLIEQNLIPDDVTIQVLTQSRPQIIEKTFAAIKGAKRAVVHLYNSTSTLQRNAVFKMSKEEIKALAVSGAEHVLELARRDDSGTEYIFEYSPESFSGTEEDYAVEVCNAVLDVWKPDANCKAIINLPNTVEGTTANVYADQVEYVCEHIKYRDDVIISLHTHNDRGCAVAASELGLLAGADRVEGTLFGNGERTGNADLVTLALNMLTNGIDPQLSFGNIDEIAKLYEYATRIDLSKRHPYVGELVYTAFSGSHQDAIRKGMAEMKNHPELWEVPYLPIDPEDVGRSYEAIIRINSQSGKGGVAFILERNYGIYLPKAMQQDFGNLATAVSDQKQDELTPEEIFALFQKEYVNIESPYALHRLVESSSDETLKIKAILQSNEQIEIQSSGNGVLSAFCSALEKYFNVKLSIVNYVQQSTDYGSESKAISYIHIKDEKGVQFFGAGISSNITKSSARALMSCLNKKVSQ